MKKIIEVYRWKSLLVFYLLGVGMGFCTGAGWMIDWMKDDAVEQSAAYYHPKTGNFTWGQPEDMNVGDKQ